MRRSSHGAVPDRRLLPFLDALAELVAAEVLRQRVELGGGATVPDEPGASASDTEHMQDADNSCDDIDIRMQLRQAAPTPTKGEG